MLKAHRNSDSFYQGGFADTVFPNQKSYIFLKPQSSHPAQIAHHRQLPKIIVPQYLLINPHFVYV